ncbi:MAG: hypothetical protein HUN04_19430 [Desulfobacter sp.]|nr:MAG: hypothetical protein HUN04_19430 [Desulfobacter sp.]
MQAMALVTAMAAVVLGFLSLPAGASPLKLEKKMLAYIRSQDFKENSRDHRCTAPDRYRVILIDNFEYPLRLTPEVTTTHGELLVKLLKSGRTDIRVTILNTTLARGLARTLQMLSRGGCADAVVSSIPGSNYTYSQMQAMLAKDSPFNPDTRLAHRHTLNALMQQIAFKGFPSVKWATRAKEAGINLIKLREDARKLAFISALGKFSIPVLLPYGNPDTLHRGEEKAFNPMTLADNALVFTGLDRTGGRMPGYPYSPLSDGDATAEYTMKECPHPTDNSMAVLDINEDGWFDFAYPRPLSAAGEPESGFPCRTRGRLRGTSLIPPQKVKDLLPPW